MALEAEAVTDSASPENGGSSSAFYRIHWIESDGLGTLDWRETIQEILNDMAKRVSSNEIAAKFHASLVEGVIMAAKAFGQNRVLLGGGCFQNKILLEGMVRRLLEEGLEPYWPLEAPPNDGGLSLGQAVIARGMLENSES
jgi:hydrogenase maturation protein HypF